MIDDVIAPWHRCRGEEPPGGLDELLADHVIVDQTEQVLSGNTAVLYESPPGPARRRRARPSRCAP